MICDYDLWFDLCVWWLIFNFNFNVCFLTIPDLAICCCSTWGSWDASPVASSKIDRNWSKRNELNSTICKYDWNYIWHFACHRCRCRNGPGSVNLFLRFTELHNLGLFDSSTSYRLQQFAIQQVGAEQKHWPYAHRDPKWFSDICWKSRYNSFVYFKATFSLSVFGCVCLLDGHPRKARTNSWKIHRLASMSCPQWS